MSRATIDITLAEAVVTIEVAFTLPAPADPNLSARVAALENPGVILVNDDHQASVAAYAVIMQATGKTVTLPPCSLSIVGRVWSITLWAAGDVTIQASSGNSFPTPDDAAETTAIINTRGSTASFRCISPTEWVIT